MTEATARMSLKPETLELIKERKPDGMDYDLYVRILMGVEDAPEPSAPS